MPANSAVAVDEAVTTRDWQARDSRHYVHPFGDPAELSTLGARVVARAEGVHVWDTDGNRIIDGLSGIGCVNLGYGRKELVEAAAKAMSELSFSQSFFRTTNRYAIQLAEKLAEITPEGLNHVFFQSSGSEANETAARLVRRYWELVGKPKKRILIARENAYHGSTMLAASLSGIPPMHFAGGDLPLPGIHHIPAPYHYQHAPDMDADAFGRVAASWLEDKIAELGAQNVAAFFAEPLQGAGGVIIPPGSYWAEIQRICEAHDVLLVVDEVVTGFGRTGRLFGSHTFGIAKPDVMNLAKGITSAYAPLGATMISERIHDALAAGGEWYHGYTYSGHPMCCAVALAAIEVFEREDIVERAVAEVMPRFAERVAELGDHPLVGDARSCGFAAGFQMVRDKPSREMFGEEGTAVGEHCMATALDQGLAFRAIETTMALMPPLVVTRDQVDEIFVIARRALDETARREGVM